METCYVRGVGGQVIAEYGTDGLLKKWNLGSFGYKIKRSGSTPESFYFLKDHIGNIRVTVNEAGDIVTKDDYYPFGLRMAGFSYNHGAPESHLKFSGKELDEEQGLKKYHFGWRDYDPELGRWNAVDPLRQFASPYVAMGNYPVGYYDEDGRFVPLLIAMGVGAAMNSMMNADKIDNWGDFFTYAGIGAGIGALGYGAALFAPAGILGGAAYGAGTGAITGGLSTWANNDFSGGIFNRGMLSGAITGGIGGGIAGYQKADAMGMDVWTGEYRPVEMEPVTLLEAPTINNKPGVTLNKVDPKYRTAPRYWYTDKSNPNYYYERLEGTPYKLGPSDCSSTRWKVDIEAGVLPKGTPRFTTSQLLQPEYQEIIHYTPGNTSGWREGDYLIFKGNKYGHVGSWTNNYRNMQGMWHNSVSGGVHFTQFGSDEWVNGLVKKYGWPFHISKP